MFFYILKYVIFKNKLKIIEYLLGYILNFYYIFCCSYRKEILYIYSMLYGRCMLKNI